MKKLLIVGAVFTASFAVGYITAPKKEVKTVKVNAKFGMGVDSEMSASLKKQDWRLTEQWHYDRMFCNIVDQNQDVF